MNSQIKNGNWLRRWSLSLASLAVKRRLMAATVELRPATLAFTAFANLSPSALRTRSRAGASSRTYLI